MHKSASFPFFKLPLLIFKILAGLDVTEAINFFSFIDLLWTSSNARGSKVSTPVAPVAAFEKVNLLGDQLISYRIK